LTFYDDQSWGRKSGSNLEVDPKVKGLIERRLHPADTRAKSVLLTSEGAGVVQRAREVCSELDRRFFATIDGETIALITTSLVRLLGRE